MTKKLTVFQFHFKTIIDTLNSGRYMDSLDDDTYIDQLLAKKNVYSLNFGRRNLSPGYLFFRVRLVENLHKFGESMCL